MATDNSDLAQLSPPMSPGQPGALAADLVVDATGRLGRLRDRLRNRISAVGAHSRPIADLQHDLSRPASRSVNRHVLLAALTGPRRKGLRKPPFTSAELRAVDPPP
ncbi:hypothetical protein M8C13_16615 [Crossiella sp. SN42]|uniref:hypothetical protein n=1 Tax=Crossiella sp. SN42 TaxID=2944808 RepID=UPI00207D4297|nr:hypothetical protein [Crossiella sp. SN42]MCO1577382.1 hypothetical protein [Crossiella sp. SN42]